MKTSPLLPLLIKYQEGLASRDFVIDYFVNAELMTRDEAIRTKTIRPGKLIMSGTPGIITFPVGERTSLIQRLKAGKPIVTTRVSDELGKYYVGSILKSDLDGALVTVVQVDRHTDISDHPYLSELSTTQKETISSYPAYDVVTLTKATALPKVHVVTSAPNNKTIGSLEALELPDDYKLSFYDRFTLTNGMIANYTGPDIETTLGVFLLNRVILVIPFGAEVPYVNGKWNIGKIERDITRLVIDGRITPAQVFRYVDYAFSISSLNDFCVPSFSEKSITARPEVLKLRQELLAKYRDQLNDPNIMIMIEDQLVALDRQLMSGDVSSGFLVSGKSFDVQRKRMFGMFGLVESFGTDTDTFSFGETNLNEGWDTSQMDVLANDIRRGSYNRAKSTALGGAESKMLSRNFQESAIVADDCGTTRGLHIHLSNDNKRFFTHRNLTDGTSVVELTESNIDEYLGKDVVIRSPMFCASKDGYCHACMDTRFKRVGIKLLNISPVSISSTILLLSMKAMHGSKTALTQLDDLNQFLI